MIGVESQLNSPTLNLTFLGAELLDPLVVFSCTCCCAAARGS
jgi:hypothetical protein